MSPRDRVESEIQFIRNSKPPLGSDLKNFRILVEEVGEVAEAINKTPGELRAELAQVAAFATLWIEKLDKDYPLS